jgi:3',5'-cyclic AMP phosphodiesterase CpdA
VANFDLVAGSACDLVVGTGDLGLDDPDDPADQDFALSRFRALSCRWRVIPGNHDIGDTRPEPWMGEAVTAERRARWVARWGRDWWAEEAEAWVVVGLDSLLFASDLPAEAEQWDWLAGVAADAGDRPVMVMLHKPPWLWEPGEAEVSQKAVTPEGRRRLLEALGPARVRVFASGHVHELRAVVGDGAASVWAPSTAFVIRAGEASAFGGSKVVGALRFSFRGRAVAWEVVRPEGMVDHDVAALWPGIESARFAPLLAVGASPDDRGGTDRSRG